MKRKLFFLSFLLLPAFSFAQLWPMIYDYKLKRAIRTFYRNGDSKENQKNGYTLSDSENGDTLVLKFNGPHPMLYKLTFHLYNGYCDYNYVELNCDTCANKYVREIMQDKKFAWKKSAENKFISRPGRQIELELLMKDGFYSGIIYRYVYKPRKEYKEIYSKLGGV